MASKLSGKKLTIREQRFLKELPTAKTISEASIKAGYSPKHPKQSGNQVLQQIKGRVPDLMDRLGLTEEVLIDKHLRRHLVAKKTVFVREKDETVKYVLDDNGTQMRALEQGFLLHGSYAPRDPKEAATFGVKVVVLDMPRPDRTIQVQVRKNED